MAFTCYSCQLNLTSIVVSVSDCRFYVLGFACLKGSEIALRRSID